MISPTLNLPSVLTVNPIIAIASAILSNVPPIVVTFLLPVISLVAAIRPTIIPANAAIAIVPCTISPRLIPPRILTTTAMSKKAMPICFMVLPRLVTIIASDGPNGILINAIRRAPTAAIIPTKDQKPRLSSSGSIVPSIFAVIPNIKIAIPIPAKPVDKPLMLIPPAPTVADAVFNALIANAIPTIRTPNTATTPTAFHKSPLSISDITATAAISIIKHVVIVFINSLMAPSLISKATAFKTLEKLLITLAVFLITFAIGLADFKSTTLVLANNSPIPPSMSPTPLVNL